MATTIKHQSRSLDISTDGVSTSVVYQGTRDELQSLLSSQQIGDYNGDWGQLRGSSMRQVGGDFWEVELKYETGVNGESRNAPDTADGKIHAELHGSLLSMPLESHPGYRTCWNHWLYAKPGAELPSDWAAQTSTMMNATAQASYRWSKGEAVTVGGVEWKIIAVPQMPGVENYEVAAYSITETARFGSAAAAGAMVANTLNRIGSPRETFGITGGDWKCDDAGVSWDGRRWVATLAWTRSGDKRGWNKILYGKVEGE